VSPKPVFYQFSLKTQWREGVRGELEGASPTSDLTRRRTVESITKSRKFGGRVRFLHTLPF